MKTRSLEKRNSTALKERGQYLIAYGVVAVMLYAAGFPAFLLFFMAMLGYFVWKVFSVEIRDETRKIFEFYLMSSEILRENDRLWYGFEVRQAIELGESIVRSMNGAPPLTYFCLGALYQKLEDHSSAANYLSRVVGENAQRESAIVYPSRELAAYVRMLRKIERSPAEAPLTSSAVRTLERLRRNKAEKMLDESLAHVEAMRTADPNPQTRLIDAEEETIITPAASFSEETGDAAHDGAPTGNGHSPLNSPENGGRQTISEVLHDIYDQNIQ